MKRYALAELIGFLDIADGAEKLRHCILGEYVESVLFFELVFGHLINGKLKLRNKIGSTSSPKMRIKIILKSNMKTYANGVLGEHGNIDRHAALRTKIACTFT